MVWLGFLEGACCSAIGHSIKKLFFQPLILIVYCKVPKFYTLLNPFWMKGGYRHIWKVDDAHTRIIYHQPTLRLAPCSNHKFNLMCEKEQAHSLTLKQIPVWLSDWLYTRALYPICSLICFKNMLSHYHCPWCRRPLWSSAQPAQTETRQWSDWSGVLKTAAS